MLKCYRYHFMLSVTFFYLDHKYCHNISWRERNDSISNKRSKYALLDG